MSTRILLPGERGRWVRRGGSIVLGPAGRAVAEDGVHGEVAGGVTATTGGVIHPNIDVYAQHALLRMAKGPDPAARTDAVEMLAGVHCGVLRGIYREDEQVPALRAKRIGIGWWQLVPAGEEATVAREPGDREAPLIAFRNRVRSDPARLDPALRKAWREFLLLRGGGLAACPASLSAGGQQAEVLAAGRAVVANVVPGILCQIKLPPPKQAGCKQRVTVAKTSAEYVKLVRTAEGLLGGCGITAGEEMLHVLSGIYYGTVWSRDFDVEKSAVRNTGFQVFLAKTYSDADDPRQCLGCGLFESLKKSGDADGVDMGHVLIGMSSRMRTLSRNALPFMGPSGLEINTWVGDLGGAAARVAMDRVKTPTTPASKYFVGRDYGATSNLEGDVAAFVVAAGSTTSPSAPVLGSVADALEAFFVKGTGRATRCVDFLTMHGGAVSKGKLTNRTTVRDAMAAKIAAFGAMYMSNFVRQRGRDPQIIAAATPRLKGAAGDVADLFVTKLEACKL